MRSCRHGWQVKFTSEPSILPSDESNRTSQSSGSITLSLPRTCGTCFRSFSFVSQVLSTSPSALEISRRLLVPDEDRRQINSPGDAAAILQPLLMHRDQEYLMVLLLDTRNRVLGEPREVYHGSLNTSLIRVGEVFRDAIKANAAAILVAHNHPSGDPSPSPEDVAVTRAIVEAGKLLDCQVLDHLVLSPSLRWVSLKERGLGFSG